MPGGTGKQVVGGTITTDTSKSTMPGGTGKQVVGGKITTDDSKSTMPGGTGKQVVGGKITTDTSRSTMPGETGKQVIGGRPKTVTTALAPAWLDHEKGCEGGGEGGEDTITTHSRLPCPDDSARKAGAAIT